MAFAVDYHIVDSNNNGTSLYCGLKETKAIIGNNTNSRLEYQRKKVTNKNN